LILFRIDVDYPYPSRLRSFLYTTLGIRLSRDYLSNPKIVARMINETSKPVKAYWFFTVKTTPDEKLLRLLDNARHEVSLHVVNDPYGELKTMEAATHSKIHYYTIHGTARFLARLMWRRKGREAEIPKDFPLKDFTKIPTHSFPLDSMCYYQPIFQVVSTVRRKAGTDFVLYFHPIWLLQRGKINHRGPFYEALRTILEVDTELHSILPRKKLFFKIARNPEEYLKDIVPTGELIGKLRERRIDIFTFLERKWCHQVEHPAETWTKATDNIALLHLTDQQEWLKTIGKKTRNMIRKAERSGIKTDIAEPNDTLAKGMWEIYNETPIRQERAFPHYGISLDTILKGLTSTRNATYVGAYMQKELVGFVQLIHGDKIAIISQILSLQKHWDKALNNALLAKTIEVCADQHEQWIMYGRMGNHPSLDRFKQSNGFTQFTLTRYYVPMTGKGKIAIRLGLQKEIKDNLPRAIKYPLFPVYSWLSRTRVRLRLKLKPRRIF
jgi:hypothetical protein